MNYEIVTTESFGITQRTVIIAREDGSFEGFPADETNPRYQQFKAEIEGQ